MLLLNWCTRMWSCSGSSGLRTQTLHKAGQDFVGGDGAASCWRRGVSGKAYISGPRRKSPIGPNRCRCDWPTCSQQAVCQTQASSILVYLSVYVVDLGLDALCAMRPRREDLDIIPDPSTIACRSSCPNSSSQAKQGGRHHSCKSPAKGASKEEGHNSSPIRAVVLLDGDHSSHDDSDIRVAKGPSCPAGVHGDEECGAHISWCSRSGEPCKDDGFSASHKAAGPSYSHKAYDHFWVDGNVSQQEFGEEASPAAQADRCSAGRRPHPVRP